MVWKLALVLNFCAGGRFASPTPRVMNVMKCVGFCGIGWFLWYCKNILLCVKRHFRTSPVFSIWQWLGTLRLGQVCAIVGSSPSKVAQAISLRHQLPSARSDLTGQSSGEP